MSPIALTIVGLLYLMTAYDMWQHNNPGMAIAFFAYAVANYGLMYAAMQGR